MENAVERAKLPGRRGRPKQFGDPDVVQLINTKNHKKCSCQNYVHKYLHTEWMELNTIIKIRCLEKCLEII